MCVAEPQVCPEPEPCPVGSDVEAEHCAVEGQT
jgi:hypothetical protein